MMKKIQKTTTTQKAISYLREFIKRYNKNKLPNEIELSKELGVSRLTLREAITVLEKEGLVSRIQGSGTKINSFVTKLQNRIDIGSDIETCLKDNGYDVRFDVIDMKKRMASEIEIQKLKLQKNDYILEIQKLLYADEFVAAYYIDRIPFKYFKTTDFKIEDFKPCIFPVIESLTQKDITHDIVRIKACLPDNNLKKFFNLDDNCPLLEYEVLEYSSDEIPLMYNSEYYTNKFINFTICRTVNYKDNRAY
ncbi:MAG: GntR family transcriptional regulator [Peptostreptococcaceae bacterium]|jgi:GntR family transcriptional regulator|nr:GntR family transcriptional regulator [Peptostreptococcaceae bacterium]